MPVDYRLYPSCWPVIRRVLLFMASNCCEQCRVPNGVYIVRDPVTPYLYTIVDPVEQRLVAAYTGLEPLPLIRIVLTIAHVNHDIRDNRPRNLRALCQRCHNVLDAQDRAKHRMLTYARRRSVGVLPLPIDWGQS